MFIISGCGFDPGSVHERFLVDEMAIEKVFLQRFQFSPVSNFPPMPLNQKSFICYLGYYQLRASLNKTQLSVIYPQWTEEVNILKENFHYHCKMVRATSSLQAARHKHMHYFSQKI